MKVGNNMECCVLKSQIISYPETVGVLESTSAGLENTVSTFVFVLIKHMMLELVKIARRKYFCLASHKISANL